MHLRRSLAAALLLLVATPAVLAQSAPDEREILKVIDGFFLALHRGDADAFEAMMRAHSRVVIVRPEGSEPQVEMREGRAMAEPMRSGSWSPFREAYWSPTVLQRGRLATVWLPYELIREEGGFSHCGIDQFTLSKTDEWRIDFVSFTIEPTRAACAELGLPNDRSLLRPQFDQVTP